MLYLVPTPIGNLRDITLRAIDTLETVDEILAEDTRITQKLLSHYGISKPVRSYHAHNEHRTVQGLVDEMAAGREFALVTDAGMPAISDPGFLLVRACYLAGIRVSVLPGPTALIAALAGSGLPADRFHFEGFLPHKKGRNKRLNFLASYPHTMVLYESPYRLVKTLDELGKLLGEERKICLVKEISKIYESFQTDTARGHLEKLKEIEKIKGEFVIIVEGSN